MPPKVCGVRKLNKDWICTGPCSKPPFSSVYYATDTECVLNCDMFRDPDSSSLCSHWRADPDAVGMPVYNGRAKWACLGNTNTGMVLRECHTSCRDGECTSTPITALVIVVSVVVVAIFLLLLGGVFLTRWIRNV